MLHAFLNIFKDLSANLFLCIPYLTFGPESRDKCYNSDKYAPYSKKSTIAIYSRRNALYNTPNSDTASEKDIFENSQNRQNYERPQEEKDYYSQVRSYLISPHRFNEVPDPFHALTSSSIYNLP